MDILSTIWMQNSGLLQGVLLRVLVDVVRAKLKEVDEKHLVEPLRPWLEPSLVVLTFVVAAVEMALKEQASNIPVDTAVLWLQTYLGAKAAGTKTVVSLVDKVNGK